MENLDNKNGNLKFTVENLHTDEMVKAELREMLGVCELTVTLGHLESLWLFDSPYIKGGEVTSNDLGIAMQIVLPQGGMTQLEFHEKLVDSLNTAWRAFEIVKPDPELNKMKSSQIETFSPEWLADMIAQTCASVPSLTIKQVLWELPLTLVLHLAVSNSRRNGAITERPNDIGEAIRLFKEQQHKEEENAQQ